MYLTKMLFTDVKPLYDITINENGRGRKKETMLSLKNKKIGKYRNAFYQLKWQGTTKDVAQVLCIDHVYTADALNEFIKSCPGYMKKVGELPKVKGAGKGLYIWEWIEDESERDRFQKEYLIEANCKGSGDTSERRLSNGVRRKL